MPGDNILSVYYTNYNNTLVVQLCIDTVYFKCNVIDNK